MNSLSFSLSLSLSLQEPPNRGVGGTRALAHSITKYDQESLESKQHMAAYDCASFKWGYLPVSKTL